MNRLLLVLLLSLLVSLSGCASQPSQQSLESVYEAIFREYSDAGVIYLRSKPVVLPSDSEMTGGRDLFDGYVFSPAVARHQEFVGEAIPIKIVDSVQTEALFADGCEAGWQAFYERYPEARVLFGLSEIGLRERNRRAIAYLEMGSSCMQGLGVVVHLSRQQGQWQIVNSETLWGGY